MYLVLTGGGDKQVRQFPPMIMILYVKACPGLWCNSITTCRVTAGCAYLVIYQTNIIRMVQDVIAANNPHYRIRFRLAKNLAWYTGTRASYENNLIRYTKIPITHGHNATYKHNYVCIYDPLHILCSDYITTWQLGISFSARKSKYCTTVYMHAFVCHRKTTIAMVPQLYQTYLPVYSFV